METYQRPPQSLRFRALETSLVEWKLQDPNTGEESDGALETSLVEWKLNEIHSAPPGVPTLETSLVEWKRPGPLWYSSLPIPLGNFLSGMETAYDGGAEPDDDAPWKLP